MKRREFLQMFAGAAAALAAGVGLEKKKEDTLRADLQNVYNMTTATGNSPAGQIVYGYDYTGPNTRWVQLVSDGKDWHVVAEGERYFGETSTHGEG